MNINMSQTDGRIRVIVAIIFLLVSEYLALEMTSNIIALIVGAILTIVALVFLWTAYTSSCPIYAALGYSTAK